MTSGPARSLRIVARGDATPGPAPGPPPGGGRRISTVMIRLVAPTMSAAKKADPKPAT